MSFSQVVSGLKIIRNGIPRLFSTKHGSEQNSEGFSLPRNGLERNSDGFSLPRNGSERNSDGVSIPRIGSERNSQCFSLPRIGLGRNSEVFLFCKTGGIPTELPSVPTCSKFCGIIFLSENDNPTPALFDFLHSFSHSYFCNH